MKKSSQLEAVAHIAHKLAHDLRKPFSTVTLFVEQIDSLTSIEDIKQLIKEYKPTLKNSITYIDNLLKELMEADVSKLPPILDNEATIRIESEDMLQNANIQCLSVTSGNKIIVIDDDPFIGRSWKRMVSDAEVISFLTPEELLEKKNSVLNDNTIIVSDFNFGTGMKIHFYEFILKLRQFFAGIIVLSTDAADDELDFAFLEKHRIKKIDKHPRLFSKLRSENDNKI